MRSIRGWGPPVTLGVMASLLINTAWAISQGCDGPSCLWGILALFAGPLLISLGVACWAGVRGIQWSWFASFTLGLGTSLAVYVVLVAKGLSEQAPGDAAFKAVVGGFVFLVVQSLASLFAAHGGSILGRRLYRHQVER
jgi:phosphotransferase system  glucose/maltose/N-acetylglucosamine-specific IIC component